MIDFKTVKILPYQQLILVAIHMAKCEKVNSH